MNGKSNDKSVGTTLAEFVIETNYSDVPAEGREAVIRSITDGVGVTLAGLSHESSKITGTFTGNQDGLPISYNNDSDRAEGALHLGTAAHALDYDDLAWSIDGHPTVFLLPPILALADRVKPSGKKAIEAYAVGFEVASYISAPISPSHYEAGWHATSTFGVFGATAAAASLLELNLEETKAALNISASTPSGLKENFGSMTKPLHAGLASRSGVTSAILAADGFTASDNAINGDSGFWSLYNGNAERNEQLSEKPTAKGWKLADPGIHLKRYPACYFTHSSIEATRALIEDHDIDPSNITEVHVEASAGAGDALKYTEPKTSLQSKFSMPHGIAVALTSERVSVKWFESEALEERRLSERRKLVNFSVDSDLPYDSHVATVTITTSDASFEKVNASPPWTHSDPPNREALKTKFLDAASKIDNPNRGPNKNDLNEVFNGLQSLPKKDLLDILRPLRT